MKQKLKNHSEGLCLAVMLIVSAIVSAIVAVLLVKKSPAADSPHSDTDDQPGSNDGSQQTARVRMKQWLKDHSEGVWLFAMFVVSALVAYVLVITIPVVDKLPDGTDTALQYVVNVSVARFGAPVVFFLLLSALVSGLGHKKGQGSDGHSFAALVLNFGAALFSFWAVTTGLYLGVTN